MALTDRINNAKLAFADTKTRMIIIVLGSIIVAILGVSYLKFKRHQLPPAGLQSAVTGVPSISSIPGLGEPTREYAKLQEQQNTELAIKASKTGTSSIPTVVRTTYLDSGVSTDLSGATSVAGCGVEELKRARLAGVTASELHCRGCSVAALKAAGYTAAELKAAGFGAAELKAAGFSADELKAAGFSAKELAQAGYSAKELLAAGFTTGELKGAGFTADDLRAAGVSDAEIAAVGFNAGNLSVTGQCSIQKLQEARGKGVSATELKKLGCSVAALKAAGFTAAELKAAGFTAAELKAAGFSAADLRAAGFNVKDLRDAGFSAAELRDAGFSAKDLKNAGFSAGELHNAGFDAQALKDAGFSAAELRAAGFSAADLSGAGFSPDELKAAGYTDGELMRAGITIAAATAAVSSGSCSIKDLQAVRLSGVSAAELKNRGCSAQALKAAGFSAADLVAAGLSADELQAAGYSATEIKFTNLKLANKDFDSDSPELAKQFGRLTDEQLSNMTSADLENFMRQQQAMMRQQANTLFATWAQIPSQQYVKGAEESKQDQQGENAKLAAAIALKNVDVYKAGTIIFAVLDSEVNSDENAPAMATVVQGPLKGSKVLGSFTRLDQKVLLRFSVLSVPKLTNSISIDAVAIDPNTAKTALASSVDNHYLLRYGTLFATSFISGLGSAVQNAGANIVAATSTTPAVTALPALTFKQQMLVGLGTVGQQLGNTAKSNINMPPTVKVKAGVSVGLVLMSDLSVPKSQENT